MKRTFVDIKEIASFNSLYNGFRLCSAGKKGKRRDVVSFESRLTENLKILQKRLLDETFVADEGRCFTLFTEGKWRKIHTVGIEDRIVHQSLVYHFNLQNKFVKRTFGSIKRRGTLAASKQVRKDIYKSDGDYVIKLDATKYYPNINKVKLMELIRSKYKGERALRLFEKVLMSYKHGELGISLGSLVSQDNGNFYLTPFDYFVLQTLKARYLSRYVDDIVIICKKEQVGDFVSRIKLFAKEYGIVFGKIEVFPIRSRRIDFCGYAVGKNDVRVRKSTSIRFIRKLRQLTKHPANWMYERNCICSYLGIFKYSNSYNLLKQLRNEYNQIFMRIDRYATRGNGKGNEISRTATRYERVPEIL